MFHTELEAVENGYLLKVRYAVFTKQWIYRWLEEAIIHRSRLEHSYDVGDVGTLREEMICKA